MLLEELEEKGLSRRSLQNRRLRRCLVGIPMVLLLVLIFVLHQYVRPRLFVSHGQSDKLTLHRYGSTPQDGMPSLPFHDNSLRRATDEVFFGYTYRDD